MAETIETPAETPAATETPGVPAAPVAPVAPAISDAELSVLREAAAELKTLKDAQLSEHERASQAKADAEARAVQAEGRLAELQATADRSRIAAEHGLPAWLADRVKGGTAEEMAADAKALAESIKGTASATLHTKPTGAVVGAGAGEPENPGDIDPVKLAAKILARRNG
ncbi:hypothetical protein OG401_23805 [Kitasatospora purpeofusca]|uniref:hypothetical protein n=1 Tax=Kitasatospora purpeofusca TaxID=67352 RepID=UPI002253BB23|nr:hypothetical protein [Kitasatospora purpeofusca]MCX4687289.1 hypothetical protein [Kitasatospora purpeofusca]